MLFNSVEFAIFLPIVFALYWFVFKKNLKLQNLFIIIVSYIFYGWWDWRFLVLIAFTSLCSFLSGLLIEKYDGTSKAKIVSVINIMINLCILCIFKYYNFFVTQFADVFLGGYTDGLLIKIILPVGISFYTFQALSYSIDVFRKKLEATHDIISFFAFISFFPQLVAGPIERATNLLPQFYKRRTFDYDKAVDGMRQILWGLFKKMVMADNCAVIANNVFANYENLPASSLVIGAICFTLQIYGDFSGYSDIAIGTARLFGFNLMRNFNFPYFSRNIAEFWRRWHISLTTWFRDYIYIPLGGSRGTKWQTVRNTLVIYLVSGFWHGANWTFICWGLYHVILFLPLIIAGKNRKYTNSIAEGRTLPNIKEVVNVAITMFFVVIGWIIFRAENIGVAVDYIASIFSTSLFVLPYGTGTDQINVVAVVIAIIVLFAFEWLNRNGSHGLSFTKDMKLPVRLLVYYFIMFSIFLVKSFEQDFIYFQF